MRTLVLAGLMVASLACGGSQSPKPKGDVLLVANKDEGNLSIVELDSGRTVTKLPTGVGPHEVAVTKDGATAVVTDYGHQTPGQTLTVLDIRGMKSLRTIQLGHSRPHGIAFLPDDRRVLVTSEASSAVLLVDAVTGTVEAAIPTGQGGSHMLAVSPDGKRVYTGNIDAGSATAIDVEGRSAVGTAATGGYSEGLGLTADGAELWVGSAANDQVVVLDATTLARRAVLPAAGFPIRLVGTPDGARVLVTNHTGARVQLFDAKARALQGTVELPSGALPVGTLISPDSRLAFVALTARNEVAVIDLETRQITRTLSVGRNPDGLGYSAAFR